MTDAATDWKIRIAGYGTFNFHGTEAEAEDMRRRKSQWEQGIGHKWRADLSRENKAVDYWAEHERKTIRERLNG